MESGVGVVGLRYANPTYSGLRGVGRLGLSRAGLEQLLALGVGHQRQQGF